MTYLLLTIFSFNLAIFVNSMSVYLQRHNHSYDRFENSLLVHSLIITPFWVLFVLLVGGLDQAYKIDMPNFSVIGYALVLAAVGLFALSIKEIGSGALVNANLFRKNKTKPTLSGVYRYLKNPIYDSYLLLFIGVGFALSNAIFFIIAATSFFGLNIIESRVERIR